MSISTKDYCQNLIDQYGKIYLDSSDTRSFDLSKLFYPLDITTDSGEKNGKLMSDKESSRILALANAGHGKTTLLRRIAIYYAKKLLQEELNDSDTEIAEKYGLHGDYIPCYIVLRQHSLANRSLAFRELVRHSVSTICSPGRTLVFGMQDEVRSWIAKKREEGRFIYLIDGLDELDDNKREGFVASLEALLNDKETPEASAPIILTSRTAGLTQKLKSRDTTSADIFDSLGFDIRIIRELKGDSIEDYARKWIIETQPKFRQEAMLNGLNAILTQSRFGFLREFMNTPLELMLILSQLTNGTLSTSRWQIFHDMFRFNLTNRFPPEVKDIYFSDALTILGYIAYWLQERGVQLDFPESIIDEKASVFMQLSYKTGLFKSTDDIKLFLREIAANTNIITEYTFDKKTYFAFPIRAYQEFLTAYACCHFTLKPHFTKAEPILLLTTENDTGMCPAMNNQWTDILLFVLAELDRTNTALHRQLIDKLAEMCLDSKNIPILTRLFEGETSFLLSDIQRICETHFVKFFENTFSPKGALMTAMVTYASDLTLYALGNLYHRKDCSQDYFHAFAEANITLARLTGASPYSTAEAIALESTQNEDEEKQNLALACYIVNMSSLRKYEPRSYTPSESFLKKLETVCPERSQNVLDILRNLN